MANNADYARQWRENNPEKLRAGRIRGRLKRYGLTPCDHTKMRIVQGDRCAMCFTPFKEGKHTTHIDHDHSTGVVRGLLCNRCNCGLGYIEDATLVAQAATYLTRSTP